MTLNTMWGKNKVVQHLVFWVLLFLIYALGYGGNQKFFDGYLVNTLTKFPFYIIAAYTFNYWQVPRFLTKKRLPAFGISLILTSYTIVVAFKFVQYQQFGTEMHIESIPSYLSKTIMFYMPALMMYAYQIQQSQQKTKDRTLLLQQEKLDTELKYLKSQLNPHFLFNTLNNLYSFVVNQSPKAADMVLQLSEILDYVLYKSQADRVSISDEVKSIDNYIALEKTRYGDRLKVVFEKQENLKDLKIAPLVLLSIVENAFKHGASGSVDAPQIKISLREEATTLIFNVWNTKSIINGSINDAYKEGIGLSNIKRQLNLIYPNNHALKIVDDERQFNINLTIKTA